jgi:hypothetical protein
MRDLCSDDKAKIKRIMDQLLHVTTSAHTRPFAALPRAHVFTRSFCWRALFSPGRRKA